MTRRIAYITWPPSEITGGIKLTFRHVESLANAGLNSVVVSPDAARPTWCGTSADVIDLQDLVRNEDILVFPENDAELLRRFEEWDNPKFVYCQNPFMMWRGLRGRSDYREFGVQAMLVLGRRAACLCRARFPALPVLHVPAAIDYSVFHFQREKQLQIAYAPRKRQLESCFMRDWFCGIYPRWRNIAWIEIEGLCEQEVANVLRSSAVYLSLQRFESVGLSALEAMACGCVVAGFTGQGGREYATDSNGFWAEEDDCLDCCMKLESAVQLVSSGSGLLTDMLRSANQAALIYGPEQLSERIVPFWKCVSDTGTIPKNL